VATFRAKPVVVEAEQWFPGKAVDGVREPAPGRMNYYHVLLSNGVYAVVNPGDWVVTDRGRGGRHLYAAKKFLEVYEPVVEEA
jgi:hypothetical protein